MMIHTPLAGSAFPESIPVLKAIAQDVPGLAPLPASPPIGGIIWTVVVPTLLFLGSFIGTYLLYRRFAKEEG